MNVSTVKAIITGGASGLGRATAARLVAGGARVAILDRPASAPETYPSWGIAVKHSEVAIRSGIVEVLVEVPSDFKFALHLGE